MLFICEWDATAVLNDADFFKSPKWLESYITNTVQPDISSAKWTNN